MNTSIEKTIKLSKDKINLLIDPKYLTVLDKQEEEKLLGERTLFLEFHRYFYAFSDEEIIKIFEAKNLYRDDEYKVFSRESFCYVNIINTTIWFHFSLRSKTLGTLPEVCNECARDYISEKNCAEDHPKITSKFLIKQIKFLIKNYT